MESLLQKDLTEHGVNYDMGIIITSLSISFWTIR